MTVSTKLRRSSYACMCETRIGSAISSFIDQFIASLDQRLQAYKLYCLVSLAALDVCQHYH